MKTLAKHENSNYWVLLTLLMLLLCLFVYFPLLTLLFVPFLCVLSEKSIIHHFTALILIFFFALLIISRDIYSSTGIGGYGDDMIHYLHAFQELMTAELSDVFNIALFNTSSSDVAFWIPVYVVSNVVTPIDTWFLLTVFTLSIFYFSFARINSQAGLCLLFCYLCTITFYTSQGSAIRQSLAFSFLCLFLSFVYMNNSNLKKVPAVTLTALSHGSGLLAVILFLTSRVNLIETFTENKLKVASTFLLGCAAFLTIIKVMPEDYYLYTKITSRLQNSDDDQNLLWFLQFTIETTFVLAMLFWFRSKINISFSILQMHIVFILIILFLLPLPEIAYRLYRFNYIFFGFYFLDFVKYKNGDYRFIFYYLLFILAITWWGSLFLNRYDGVYFDTNLMGLLNLGVNNFFSLIWNRV